jgi:sigma-B regulation protein RsbU (phosphoserine phosphatase)
MLRTGEPLVGIEEMETWPDGSVTWVSTTKLPLRDDSGQIIGTFGISREITERKRAELALAERTRQLHQRNQQMEEEIKIARELQMALLPHHFRGRAKNPVRKESGLQFFSFFFPRGAVSGDFFDIVEFSPTRAGVFVVMGHGVQAALVAAMLRALIGDLSQVAQEPGHLLAQINKGLASVFKMAGQTMYATACYVIADTTRGELHYANAGHPEPIHLRRRRGIVERLGDGPAGRKSPALGLFDQATFPTSVKPLAGDDLVALFTDGLTNVESSGQQPFGEEGLADAVLRRAGMPSGELLQGLFEEVRRFSGNGDFGDDVCLIGLERKRS